MRYSTRLGALTLFAATAGCAELETIEDGTCGNRVIEGAEDCDGFPPDWFPQGKCRESGEPLACHLDCDPSVADGQANCPPGWACGGDGACRRASGTFEEDRPVAEVLVEVPRLLAGDIDADHHDDLVTQTSNRMSIQYLGDNGDVADTIGLSATPVAPVLGHLTPQRPGRFDIRAFRLRAEEMWTDDTPHPCGRRTKGSE